MSSAIYVPSQPIYANDLEVVQLSGQGFAAFGQLLLPEMVGNQHGGALLREHACGIRRYLMLRPVGIPVGDHPSRHCFTFVHS